jgi:hypothetical protein
MEVKKAYKTFRYPGTVSWTHARRGRASAPGKADIEVGTSSATRSRPKSSCNLSFRWRETEFEGRWPLLGGQT